MAAYRTTDHGVRWVDFDGDTHDIFTMAHGPGLDEGEAPLSLRAILVDVEGRVVADAWTPATESASTARAVIDAPISRVYGAPTRPRKTGGARVGRSSGSARARGGRRRVDAPTDIESSVGGSDVDEVVVGGPGRPSAAGGSDEGDDRMDVDASPEAVVEPGRTDEAGDATSKSLSLLDVLEQHGVKTHHGQSSPRHIVQLQRREAQSLRDEFPGITAADIAELLGVVEWKTVVGWAEPVSVDIPPLGAKRDAWRAAARNGAESQSLLKLLYPSASGDYRRPDKNGRRDGRLKPEVLEFLRKEWLQLWTLDRYKENRNALAKRLGGVKAQNLIRWEREEKWKAEFDLRADVQFAINTWRETRSIATSVSRLSQLVSSVESVRFDDVVLDRNPGRAGFGEAGFPLDPAGELIMALLISAAQKSRPEERLVTTDQINHIILLGELQGDRVRSAEVRVSQLRSSLGGVRGSGMRIHTKWSGGRLGYQLLSVDETREVRGAESDVLEQWLETARDPNWVSTSLLEALESSFRSALTSDVGRADGRS